MKYKIRGEDMPILDVELNKGDTMFTETGGMAWMTPNISMETNTNGGVFKGITRAFAGESFFMTTYGCIEGTGIVSFCSEFPGRIIPLDLKAGQSIICQRDAFMAAEKGVDIKIAFNKRLGAGFFGGEGFILQKISGPGKAFLEIDGEVTEYKLEKGQMLKVDPGYIGAFESTVSYDITRVKGIKNMLFSGEGIFLATLEGPGKVYLQSMPLSNFVKKINKYLPKERKR